ncbi:MAG: hypothetical protein JXR23_06040 [Pontiellaceae bacterium]|nr:hypothetical protein [Pontiellaceae bacterium]
MRIYEALRTTKSSLFTEFFHERSWKKRGGLRNLICFLAVLMFAGAASAAVITPVNVVTKKFSGGNVDKGLYTISDAIKNTNIVAGVEGAPATTNIFDSYQYTIKDLSLAANENVLVFSAYLDTNNSWMTNATYAGVPADGFIGNTYGQNRMATWYWKSPSTAANQQLVIENKTKHTELEYGFVGLSGVALDLDIEPSMTPGRTDSQAYNDIYITTNNMHVISFFSCNQDRQLVPPEKMVSLGQKISDSGGATLAGGAKWFSEGDTNTAQRITWTGGNNGNYSVHAIAFPSIKSVEAPYYLPEIKYTNLVPAKDATGVKNPVKLSTDVVLTTTELISADLYLGDMVTPIASTTNFGPYVSSGTTVTVSAVNGEKFLAKEVKNARIIINTTETGLQTNNWKFTMGDAVAYTLSPAKDAYANSFNPEVSATVVDVVDTVYELELYVDGELRAIEGPGANGTSVVSYTAGPYEPGQKVDCEVIVYNTDSEFYTNSWSFTVGGGTNTVTAWPADGAPELGTYDIAQLVAPSTVEETLGYHTNVNDRHAWTFISSYDRPAQGQTFTTPTVPGEGTGFDVDSIWIKTAGYLDGDNFAWNVGDEMTLRITDPSKTNTTGFVVSTHNIEIVNSATKDSGEWVQLRLPEKVTLRPGKQYGFDVAVVGQGSYFNTDTVGTDEYPAGTAYSSGVNGIGDNSMMLPPEGGDRSFIVELNASDELFLVTSVTPAPESDGVKNPVVIDVEFVELKGLYDVSSEILLDGNNEYQTLLGTSPEYTLRIEPEDLRPSTTHTAEYFLVSGAPSGMLTNSFVFTMGEGFSFDHEVPRNKSTTTSNVVPLSVAVVNIAESGVSAAKLLLDGNELQASINPVTGTETTIVSAVTGTLAEGHYKVDLIVTGAFEDLVKTNSWEFYVKMPTEDTSWNINFAGPVGGTLRAVNDGTIAVAAPSGWNAWNNLRGTEFGTSESTNNFYNIQDTSRSDDNIIGLETHGIYWWGDVNLGQYGGVQMTVDMFEGWVGGSNNGNDPKFDAYSTITGLNTSASYDIIIYSTWTWQENATRFDIIEGYPLDGDTSKTLVSERDTVSGLADDDYSTCVEDQHYVVFRKVTPTPDGIISFRGGFGVDTVMSGLQIREYADAAVLPYATLSDAEPEGSTKNPVTPKVVLVDAIGNVQTNNVSMWLDGKKVGAIAEKSDVTTTVSFAASTLTTGEHEFSIHVPSDMSGVPDYTNSWEFYVTGMGVVPTELVHHWNFEEGTGTVVNDVEGGNAGRGTIHGTRHEWITGGDFGGGLKLLGGGSSQDWNADNPDLTALGSYVDLPNGIISQLGDGDTITIEVVYQIEAASSNWARVYDFGTSQQGEDKSGNATNTLMYTVKAGNSGLHQIAYRFTEMSTYQEIDLPGLPVGEVHHFAFCYDRVGRTIRLMQDGQINKEEAIAGSYSLQALNDNNNFIGRSQWQDPMFAGTIYDMRISTGIMTEAEALARYQDVIGYQPPPPQGPAVGLTVPAGGPLTISWLSTGGNNNYSVMTNADLTNPNAWGVVEGEGPDLVGDYWTISIPFGEESSLFYKLQSN